MRSTLLLARYLVIADGMSTTTITIQVMRVRRTDLLNVEMFILAILAVLLVQAVIFRLAMNFRPLKIVLVARTNVLRVPFVLHM